jgi:hypothetical protein
VILGVADMTLKSQNDKITRGAYIRVVGDRVELTVALAALEFVPADGTAKADLTKVLVNKPSGLMVLVPQYLALGPCCLKLTTQFSPEGGKTLTPLIQLCLRRF